MNARLDIITEEKSGVYSVPYEAIVTGDDGKCYVYALQFISDQKASAYMVPVEKGLETNLYVEITGENLKDGMQIVKNAHSIDGIPVAANAPGEDIVTPGDSGTSEISENSNLEQMNNTKGESNNDAE